MPADLVFIPFFVLGAAWAWWDGSDYAGVLPTLARLAIAVVIGSIALWTAHVEYIPLGICLVVAILNIHIGRTKWESYKVMIPRFGVPSLAVFVLTGSWIYVLLSVIAGGLYPALYKYPRGEEIARCFKGAFLIGGLSIVSYMSVAPIIVLGN
jgi:hypothetical protein